MFRAMFSPIFRSNLTVYTVKRWTKTSPETCRAEFKKINKRKLLHLVGYLHRWRYVHLFPYESTTSGINYPFKSTEHYSIWQANNSLSTQPLLVIYGTNSFIIFFTKACPLTYSKVDKYCPCFPIRALQNSLWYHPIYRVIPWVLDPRKCEYLKD
jgi:hypothetical protein